jgi:2-polyprenyl-3-methyl-5-hydroxy-6-metoxy-1,4-benzoquinol methylase
MADQKTLQTYNENAVTYAKEWQEQPAPEDMYELLLKYFKHGITADVGCGAGRDTAWLSSHGFEAYGFDMSEGLLNEARRSYPQISFQRSELPGLNEIEPGTFDNVLCETVIMHLEKEQIPEAVKRLADITKIGGVLYLSWRVTENESIRDNAGRLYTAFSKELVLQQFKETDTILFDKESVSASSGRKIHRLIVRKS